jgi:hypothetical protein
MSPRVSSSKWRVSWVGAPLKDAPAWAVAQFHLMHEDGPWVLTGLVASVDGVPVVAEMTLHSHLALWGDDVTKGAITGELLKSIPMGRVLQEVTADVAVRMEELAREDLRPEKGKKKVRPQGPSFDADLLREGMKAFKRRDLEALSSFPDGVARKRGRPVSVETHAGVARAVLALQAADKEAKRESKNLVRRLAERDDVELETMRSRVKAAVTRGFLKSRGAGAQGYVPGLALDEFESTRSGTK